MAGAIREALEYNVVQQRLNSRCSGGYSAKCSFGYRLQRVLKWRVFFANFYTVYSRDCISNGMLSKRVDKWLPDRLPEFYYSTSWLMAMEDWSTSGRYKFELTRIIISWC